MTSKQGITITASDCEVCTLVDLIDLAETYDLSDEDIMAIVRQLIEACDEDGRDTIITYQK